MEKKKKEKILDVFAWIFFAFWIVSTLVGIYVGTYHSIFWFCNFSVAIISIALFQKSLNFLYFFLAIGLFFQTPWILDWISYLLFNYSFFNMIPYYLNTPLYFLILTFIRHTLSVPVVFVLLFLFKPKMPDKKSAFLLSVIIVFVMVVSYLFDDSYNINCARYFCSPVLNGFLGGIIYSVGWTILIILISLLSVYFIIYPIHKFISKVKFV